MGTAELPVTVALSDELLAGRTVSLSVAAKAASALASLHMRIFLDGDIASEGELSVSFNAVPGGQLVEHSVMLRVPDDVVQRRIEVDVWGTGVDGSELGAKTELVTSPAGRPRVTTRCLKGLGCHRMPVDLIADVKPAAGAVVTFKLIALGRHAGETVDLSLEFPPGSTVEAGIARRGPVHIAAEGQDAELTATVRMPDKEPSFFAKGLVRGMLPGGDPDVTSVWWSREAR